MSWINSQSLLDRLDIQGSDGMRIMKNEDGVIMVEASIYMPLVLCTVMALLYLALFNMQEYLLMYQAQRVSAAVSREEAYLGYKELGMGRDNEIDFSWGGARAPSEAKVKSYYKAHHSKVSALYRETRLLGLSGETDENYAARFAGAAHESALIVLGSISSPEVEVERGFLGTEVKVTITHSLPVPGVLKYLGYEEGTTLRVAAYSYALNPGEFVRNVDLAADLVSYIMEKMGLSGSYQEFLGKTEEVLAIII